MLTGNPEEDVTGIKTATTQAPCFSLYEDSLRIGALRSLVAASRPMTVSDWDPQIVSDVEIASCEDLGDIRDRYLALYSSLNDLRREMDGFLKDYDSHAGLSDSRLAKALSLMAGCISGGVYEAAVTYPSGLSLTGIDKLTGRVAYDETLDRQEEYMAQFANACARLDERLKAAAGIAPVSGEVEISAETYRKAIRELTLNSFIVISRFRPADMLEPDWYRQYGYYIREGASYYANAKPGVIQDWTENAGAVHPGMQLWNQIEMIQELSEVAVDESPVILQRRSDSGAAAYWMGTACAEEYMSDADSLMLYGSGRMKALGRNSWYAGMVFDSWMEFVPFSSHKAGLVFRCNQPDAEAPQSILLAVYPELRTRKNTSWDLAHLLNILDSTRFQIMNRAVDPDMIYNDPKLSQIFPLFSDAFLNLFDVNFLYTSFVSKEELKLKIQKAVDSGIFDYMPGGTILKDLLKQENYGK